MQRRQACWSSSGQEIYVGRRSAIVEIYDIRTTTSTPSTFSPVLQTIKLPKLSGAVSCVKALPSGHHLISGSHDNLRIWDLDRIEGGKDYSTGMIGWRIIPGHHGGAVSQMRSSLFRSLFLRFGTDRQSGNRD